MPSIKKVTQKDKTKEKNKIKKNMSVSNTDTQMRQTYGKEKHSKSSLSKQIKDHHEKGYKKALYYANWNNLLSDIKKMGFSSSIQKILGIMAGYAALVVAVGILMKLWPACYVVMIAAGFFIVPMIIVNMYKKIYEDNRFAEVSQYIEQMLYSFKNSNKVLKSLQDIHPMFKGTPMEKAIEKCIDDIPEFGLEKALNNFENIYDCQKIHQLNEFMLEVETVGGDHDNAIDLLLQDRELWVNRTSVYKKERNNKKITVFMAIFMSFGLCVVMEKILPSEGNITNSMIYQVSAIILFIADLILFYITDNICSESILNSLKLRKDSEIKKYYEYIVNYDARREFIKNLKVLPVGVAIAGYGLFTQDMLITGIGVVFALFCLVKHKMTYHTRFKAIKSEIEIQFPRWLMNVALYVQSNSVQVALYKSIPTAPLVLQPELIKLNNAIRDNPTSIDPYIDFMKDFELPNITMSMKMFYAIASGAGSDIQQQINEIIKRNNSLLDQTEKIANDNMLARMYMLFLAPQLTGGGKILIDMVVFFNIFMGTLHA